jgi:putative ABC transport system ATP-binding protein
VTELLLQSRNLTVAHGRTVVVTDVSIDIRSGDEVALLGRSGAGKTTLLLALAGLVRPAQGTVTYENLDDRVDIGMVFQAPSLLPELTAVENVALPMRLRGVPGPTAYRRAESALGELGIVTNTAMPNELSGGQQQRVAVARVLASRPRIVLADEPTGALDRATALKVLAALRRHVAEVDGALVVASHDEELVGELPRQLVLSDGAVAPGVTV